MCREYQMLSNVLKSLYAAPSFLKASYIPLISTHPGEVQLICQWTCVFNQTPNWQTDRKHSGNSQLKPLLEFRNWPAHSSSYIKMLGRGSLSCQDPLHLCWARTDTRSLGEATAESARHRQGWGCRSPSPRTHPRRTNQAPPLPNTEKCDLEVSHVYRKDGKAAPAPTPFPYFPNSLYPALS